MKNEILMSMGCVLDVATPWFLTMKVEGYVSLAKKAGYDGIDYFPIRFFPSLQGASGKLSQDALDFIKSAHQSYRSEKTIFEAINHPAKALALFSYVALPERRSSVMHLLKLQSLKPNLPLVLYPHHENSKIAGRVWDDPQYPEWEHLQHRLFQPEAGLMSRWNVSNSSELVIEALDRGYEGVCLDLYHLRREPLFGSAGRFEPWQKSILSFQPYTKMVHIRFSGGNEEFETHFKSDQELKSLLLSEENEQKEMLLALKRLGYDGPIVIEVPFKALRQTLKLRPFVMPGVFVHIHQNLVYSIKKILSEA